MDIYNYLQELVSKSGTELHLEPNKNPYVVTTNGQLDITNSPLQGGQISMIVFPMIPDEAKRRLPDNDEIEFPFANKLGNFNVKIKKSSSGFNVVIMTEGSSNFSSTVSSQSYVPFDSGEDESAILLETPIVPSETPVQTFNNFGNQQTNSYEPKVTTLPTSNLLNNPASALYDSIIAEPLVAEQKEVFAEKPTYQVAKVSGNAKERIDALFHAMAEFGSSDLHLSVSTSPMVRKDGIMQTLKCNESVLTPEVMKELLTSIMPAKNQEEFANRHDTDFAYEIAGLARFRANIFQDRKGMGGVFRIIPSKILTAEQLGLSKQILDLCNLSKGLVVVTGPTGSGKSTTLCAMVDHINKQREDHIITIEDPIEFTHENNKCLVNQREVHNHTDSFKDALRAALREDPDILLVGEMRDLETISIAIETAETGHLVFGTLHTTTAASTVDRIIDQFPADRQQQIRVMLSESLKGVIAQTLLPKKGGGRVAALEILIVTPAISNLIREGKTFQIPSAMQTGKQLGMVMLNDALMKLVTDGLVEPRDAYIKCVDKTGFEMALNRAGLKL
jgi:twitching motility protein PilT